VDGINMDAVSSFCYLGDTLCGGGGCELAVATRCSVDWGKFKKLLLILSSKHVSLKTRGKLYSSCVYAPKTSSKQPINDSLDLWNPTS